MSKDYVIVNIETNGYFDIDDNKQIIFIEALKIDKNMKKKDEFGRQLLDRRNEKDVLCEFIDFCFNSKIIIYNAKEGLSFLLKELYKNNIISNFKFKYIDMIDLLKKKEKDIGLLIISNIKKYYNIKCDNEIECIFDIINIYLKDNNIDNLDNMFLLQRFYGKIFRGLNYPKYLCDIIIGNNKYYGYIVDNGYDKYVSYYSLLKELNGEYFSLDEIKMLKKYGAKIIMNIGYLCDESMSFVDYYFLQAIDSGSEVTSDCYRLINGIDRFIEYYKYEKRLKLILWGSIDRLEEQYKIIDKDKLEYIILSLNLIKEPWDYFTKDDINRLESS